MGFIDSHAHLPLVPGARERLIAVMDELKIETAVVVAGGAVTPVQLSKQITLGGGLNVDIDNAALLKSCQESEGRLLPFFFANPHAPADVYANAGKAFAGLKLGPAVHGISLLDDRTYGLVEVAHAFGHPVYLHCLSRPGFAVEDLVVLAGNFPEVRFILGHAGIGNCDLYALSLIENSSNIYFETSGGFLVVVSSALKQLGADRVLFGSEYPLQHPAVELEKARRLNLSEAIFEKYTRSNIQDLLGGSLV